MPFAVWITGLPGSGKTAIANELIKKLRKNKIKHELLSMDRLRKKIVKMPKYTDEERDAAYRNIAKMGIKKIQQNKNVIFDATAHKKKYRNYARKKIKNFIEVYVKCPLKICIERESGRKQGLVAANLYRKALERKNKGIRHSGIGKVVGVDTPYGENKNAEIAINSDKISPNKAARRIIVFLERKKLI